MTPNVILGMLKKWAPVTGWLSLVLSLSAMAVSIRSCSFASQSDDRARQAFEEKRAIVLRLSKTGPVEYALSPLDSSIELYETTIIYPFEHPDIQFAPPSNKASLPIKELTAYIEQKVPKEKNTVLFGYVNLPVVVRSEYVSQSKRHSDFSLYQLQLDYAVRPGREYTQLTVNTLIYVGRLDPRSEPRSILLREDAALTWRHTRMAWMVE